jgi:hypothetical protein
LPAAYERFDPDSDESVIFIAVINHPGRPYALRGRLRRPDGVQQAEFRRDVPETSPTTYFTSEPFPIAALRAFPGHWHLDLFMEEERVGTYAFVLGRRP